MHLLPFESKSLQVYSPQSHAALRFHLHDSLGFARQWLFLPVHRLEALRLYKQVPVLFYKDHQDQLSLAALLFNQNGHVIKGDKQCSLNYLPVTFRLYPFSWIDQDNTSRLAIYSQAPHFQGRGEKLFTSKSKPTQRMREIFKHIGLARNEYQKTRELLKELASRVTLKPLSLKLVQPGGTRNIGFLAIDQDTLKLEDYSGELRDLILAHCRSIKLLQAAPDSAAKGVKPQQQQQITPNQLVDQVCDQFNISLEDLLSRKRGQLLVDARKALALKAQEQGIIDAVAQLLERTPATLKRWAA